MIATESSSRVAQILIVDDEKTLRLMLSRAMQKDGYKITEAESGEACLCLCQQQLPDIILLDAMLPGMDGFTCCAQLQQTFGDRCPPVLMITSLNDQVSVDRAFDVGATDFVTKPIHWAVLRQRVRRLLQANWALAELRQKIAQEQLLLAQLEAANQELQRLACVDSLTQLANRRRFDEYLQQEWQRLAEGQSCLSLILLDIDCFKRYNDTYGHQQGDDCLKRVAQLISHQLPRSTDLAARYGGEEFAVILPDTDLHEAVQVAEAIQAALEAASLPHNGSTVSNYVTLSGGVTSQLPTADSSIQELIAAADRLLYQAKLEGRDRILAKDSSSNPCQ